MKNKAICLAFLLVFSVFWLGASLPFPAAHDIHLSKCQITFPVENTLDLKCHIWLDDLTAALVLNGLGDPKLLTPGEAPDANTILMKYLFSKIKIRVNGQLIQPAWVDKKASEDGLAVWIHLQAQNLGKVKTVSVTNELLRELYRDQQNIVHLKGPGSRQGYLIFEKPGQQESINF
ncbi:MAG: DUF6702 family protein [Saprospiraceae bacterium]